MTLQRNSINIIYIYTVVLLGHLYVIVRHTSYVRTYSCLAYIFRYRISIIYIHVRLEHTDTWIRNCSSLTSLLTPSARTYSFCRTTSISWGTKPHAASFIHSLSFIQDSNFMPLYITVNTFYNSKHGQFPQKPFPRKLFLYQNPTGLLQCHSKVLLLHNLTLFFILESHSNLLFRSLQSYCTLIKNNVRCSSLLCAQ